MAGAAPKHVALVSYQCFRLLRTVLFACVRQFAVASALASKPAAGIRVRGPGVQPQLMFACCDQGDSQMQSLFSDPHVIADLKDLHAGLGVAISDFSPERAELVRRLNQARIPVIAWLMLPKEQGFYFNADNEPEAAARFAAFDAWSRDQGCAGRGSDSTSSPISLSWQLPIAPLLTETYMPESRAIRKLDLNWR